MVVFKGRINSATNRTAQEHKMSNARGGRTLKIYTETEKVRLLGCDSLNNDAKGKSVPLNSGNTQLTASSSKMISKNFEGSKSKNCDPVKKTVGRKVLADISNVKGSFLRMDKQGKRGDTVGLDGSSRRLLMGKARTNSIQASETARTLNKSAADKSKKGTSYVESTKVQGRKSATSTSRTSGIIPRPVMRNSLPVLKQVSKVEANEKTEEKIKKSGDLRGKQGFPVKSRVGRNVTQLSNPSGYPWRNRASDGFVIAASRARNKEESGVLPRKSLRPIVKTTTTVSKSTKLNRAPGLKKLTSSAATSSKRKEDTDRTYQAEDVPLVISSDKPAQVEDVSDSDSNIGGVAGNIIARKKSGRRSSYTSSLMARSKLLKGFSEIKQETLPSIYDDCNHLEVSDYVDDIYQYYWVMEAQYPLLKNYMQLQTDITPQMRGILVNWLIEVHLKFDLMQETLFLMITLLDRYLSREIIAKNEMQLVGLTALLLASKYEDFWHPRVSDLIGISAESYTRDQMLKMEKTILKKLMFRLNEPTLYVFMLRFLKAAQADMKFEHLAFYLVELCLVEYEALNYKPSMLCASAVYLARHTMQLSPAWTPLLTKHARYKESDIRACAEMILKFHKAAKTNMLKVTYEKYMSADYSRVATIKPLIKLPP